MNHEQSYLKLSVAVSQNLGRFQWVADREESKAYFGSPFSVKAGLFLHPLCICDATLESSKLLYII